MQNNLLFEFNHINNSNKSSLQRITGSGNKECRNKNDFYATPKNATISFLETFHSKIGRFSNDILEPSCGDGAISEVLQHYNYNVFSTDLIDRGFCSENCGLEFDFLSQNYTRKIPNKQFDIITNPPFNILTDYIIKAKSIAHKRVAIFARLQILEGVTRYEKLYSDQEFPLAYVFQYVRRIACNGNGLIAFAWFVFEKGYTGNPQILWIN
jgi:hypothetical protein